jgi:molecular chaperone GrpE (heat shock protein)
MKVLVGRLKKMYDRKPDSHLKFIEQGYIAEIARSPDALEELSKLEAFKRVDPYFPKSLESLLDKWQSTLDRSKIQPIKPNDNGRPNSCI